MTDKKKKEIFNIPNLITLLRFILIPVFIQLYAMKDEKGRLLAAAVFAVAACSDWLDGFLARKFNQITPLGEALDPLADKLMQTVAVLCLYFQDTIKLWIVALFIIKEILMISISSILFSKEKHCIPSRWYGKISTAFFFFIVFVTIAFKDIPPVVIDAGFSVAVILAVYSFIRYSLVYLDHKKYNR